MIVDFIIVPFDLINSIKLKIIGNKKALNGLNLYLFVWTFQEQYHEILEKPMDIIKLGKSLINRQFRECP